MKKMMYLLLALPMLMLAACDDDDNKVAQVTFSMDYSGATEVDGVYYVVEGTPFVIDGVSVTPVRQGVKAIVTQVSYGVDGTFLGTSLAEPFGATIPTEGMALGRHTLTMQMPVMEEGCAPSNAFVKVPFEVVAADSDIPGDATQTTGHAALPTSVK